MTRRPNCSASWTPDTRNRRPPRLQEKQALPGRDTLPLVTLRAMSLTASQCQGVTRDGDRFFQAYFGKAARMPVRILGGSAIGRRGATAEPQR